MLVGATLTWSQQRALNKYAMATLSQDLSISDEFHVPFLKYIPHLAIMWESDKLLVQKWLPIFPWLWTQDDLAWWSEWEKRWSILKHQPTRAPVEKIHPNMLSTTLFSPGILLGCSARQHFNLYSENVLPFHPQPTPFREPQFIKEWSMAKFNNLLIYFL